MDDENRIIGTVEDIMTGILSSFDTGDVLYKILLPQIPDAIYVWFNGDSDGQYVQIMPGDFQMALLLQAFHAADEEEEGVIDILTTGYRGFLFSDEKNQKPLEVIKRVAGVPLVEWTTTDIAFLHDIAGIVASSKSLPGVNEIFVLDTIHNREYKIPRPTDPYPETNLLITDPTFIRRLANLRKSTGFLEVDINPGYAEVAEDGTTTTSLIVTVVEPASGTVLFLEAAEVQAYVAMLVNGLAGILVHVGRVAGIYYTKGEVRRIIGHMVSLAGIPMNKRQILPATKRVMETFRMEME